MRKTVTTTLTVAAIAAAGLGLGPVAANASGDRSYSSSGRSSNLEAIGLAGDRTLVRFDTKRPGDARRLGDVRGLSATDRDLVGIDYRVQDGKLYGVGRGGGVYSINLASQRATRFAQLTIPLEGTDFGVDFNPAANALRVISNTGQNLRQPFAVAGAATVADTKLSTPPAPGPTTGVTGAAYTNNDLDTATATTLFDLATATNQVSIQSPANSGTLAATGTTTVELAAGTGFDIYSKVRGGKAVELFPFAVNGGRLYAVNLFNGQLKDAGRIGRANVAVTDLAIPLNQL